MKRRRQKSSSYQLPSDFINRMPIKLGAGYDSVRSIKKEVPIHMKKTITLYVSLLIFLTIGIFTIFTASAQPIQPSGKAIGSDKQGNAIYQVTANGIDMGYKLIGSGEPLVMIMGLGGTMDNWPQEIIEALSKKYQLILLDNRGMGYTTANDVTFTYKLFADDVIGLLDTLRVEKTHVLGFSMGSTITQELLLEYPQRFDKAIIYATSTDGTNVAATLKGKAPLGESSMNPIVLRQIEATTHWKTPLDRLSSITNQVMFIVGTSDAVVGVDSSKTLASAIPGAWLVQFKNGSHGLMIEAPTEFTKIVLDFLEIDETVGSKP
jgi:pimeloyl-ACP methyl ester carboxylesterase